MIAFLAHFLIVLAAWTVTIKFLFPLAYALAEGAPVVLACFCLMLPYFVLYRPRQRDRTFATSSL